MRILELPKTWQGWYFWEDYFVDPEGNRYSVEMVRSSLFTLQLSHELRGSTLQIRSLKQELHERLEDLRKYQTMTITWGDQSMEIVLQSHTMNYR